MSPRVLLFTLALACILVACPVAAQSPSIIPVQGNLADADGQPVSGTRAITFSLYGDPAGASQMWSETLTLDLQQGFFAAYLGETTPVDLTLFRDYSQVYLGVAVDGDAEMPLIRLASSPFAGYATFCGDAGTLGGRSFAQLADDIELSIGDTTHARYTDAEAIAAMGALGDTNPLNHNRFSPSDAVAAMGAVADANPLNHNRYTDAEAVAAVGPHFTNADAVAAMGAVADANPLNHNRYTDAEAVAAVGPHYTNAQAVAAMGTLGNANPLNHDRYTDAEALAAVAGGNLTVNGAISAQAASTISLNANDANAGVELRSSGGVPYVDFSNDTSDFDARIQLTGDDTLLVTGANLEVRGAVISGAPNYGATTFNVASYFTNTSTADYIHLRLPYNLDVDNRMYHVTVRGYAYGAATKIIDLTYVGYCYKNGNALLNTGSLDPTGAFGMTHYVGSDRNIYLRFQASSTYYLSFAVDSMYVGNGRIIQPGEITVIQSSTANL